MKYKFKIGDKVKVLSKGKNQDYIAIGEEYVIGDFCASDDTYWITDNINNDCFGHWLKEDDFELVIEDSIESLKKEIAEKQRELSKLLLEEQNKPELIMWDYKDDKITGCFELKVIHKNMSAEEILKKILEEIEQ